MALREKEDFFVCLERFRGLLQMARTTTQTMFGPPEGPPNLPRGPPHSLQDFLGGSGVVWGSLRQLWWSKWGSKLGQDHHRDRGKSKKCCHRKNIGELYFFRSQDDSGVEVFRTEDDPLRGFPVDYLVFLAEGEVNSHLILEERLDVLGEFGEFPVGE